MNSVRVRNFLGQDPPLCALSSVRVRKLCMVRSLRMSGDRPQYETIEKRSWATAERIAGYYGIRRKQRDLEKEEAKPSHQRNQQLINTLKGIIQDRQGQVSEFLDDASTKPDPTADRAI